MTSSLDDLLAANAAFYAAFETGSPTAMAAVWSDDDDVACTHPGWPMVHGPDDVRQSWFRILVGPRYLQFIVSDERAFARGDVGWVSCVENILGDRGPQGSASALNVFRRDSEGAWRMVIHHASPLL